MRGKLAKYLRRKSKATDFVAKVDVAYVAKTYTRYVPGFNAHGEPEMQEVKKVTIMLGNCTRRIYQQLKKGVK